MQFRLLDANKISLCSYRLSDQRKNLAIPDTYVSRSELNPFTIDKRHIDERAKSLVRLNTADPYLVRQFHTPQVIVDALHETLVRIKQRKSTFSLLSNISACRRKKSLETLWFTSKRSDIGERLKLGTQSKLKFAAESVPSILKNPFAWRFDIVVIIHCRTNEV